MFIYKSILCEKKSHYKTHYKPLSHFSSPAPPSGMHHTLGIPGVRRLLFTWRL